MSFKPQQFKGEDSYAQLPDIPEDKRDKALSQQLRNSAAPDNTLVEERTRQWLNQNRLEKERKAQALQVTHSNSSQRLIADRFPAVPMDARLQNFFERQRTPTASNEELTFASSKKSKVSTSEPSKGSSSSQLQRTSAELELGNYAVPSRNSAERSLYEILNQVSYDNDAYLSTTMIMPGDD